MPGVKEPRYFTCINDPPAMVGRGDEQSNEAAGAVYRMEDDVKLFVGTTEAAVAEAPVNDLYQRTVQ